MAALANPIMPGHDGPIVIEVGSSQPVTLDKVYGPTDFAGLRITADTQRGWVIEREWGDGGQWVEWSTIPAQLAEEYAGAEPPVIIEHETWAKVSNAAWKWAQDRGDDEFEAFVKGLP